ncbi:MAG TPA: translesion error-prone DNA polymerase V autoproteolytic subunit [Candidatus Paceibacterota bacterium]|nr:translesion error-prone DNA polymerase V autoproteolytic subunit [Candidatus Paceibacterota bacterium]
MKRAHGKDAKATVLGTAAETRFAAPLYASQPAAGFPAPGDDAIERSLDIHDLLVRHPASTFFVRVSGESMEGAGIFDGDVLSVDRALEARDGHIVVAAVFGELVVKRLASRGGKRFLVSEHEGYQPIAVDGADDCVIWGVVTGSVRQFL